LSAEEAEMIGGLNSVLSIAGSGLAAAGAQMAVTASNLANLETGGYQARRADLVELSGGGVGVGGVSSDPAPGALDAEGVEGSNVDPAKEVVDLMREKTLYTANAAVVTAADRMVGSLLNILDRTDDRGRQRPR
jgi:flagellar basal body rod protein FlgG